MKNIITLLTLTCVFNLYAQQQAPPQGINYQAVAIDNDGNEMVGIDLKGMPVAEKEIRVRFSILKDSETGILNYREQHLVTTDAYGLFNTVIGQGIEDTSPIAFDQIDWGTGYHFLKVEIDIKGGTEYKDMGTQQLWSVPYALYSKYTDAAGNGIESVNDNGDGTLTFTYLDGSTYTTPTLTGLTGPQGDTGPQGPQGDTGNGIVNTLDNGDGTLTFEYADGTTFTTSDLTGQQGPQGATGNGIASTVDNGDGTFTFTYDDGTTFTTSDLTGPQGATGAQGAQGSQGIQGIQGVAGANGTNGTNGLDGNGIASTVDNGDGTFTFTYDDGTTFTTSDLTGPQGATGTQGAQGIQGIQGVAGAIGTNGTNGLDGNGIASTVDNGDGTFTLTYDDGSTFTTSDLTGPQGATGAQGAQGIQGIQGIQGVAGANGINGTNGLDGNGIASTVDNGDGTFTFTYDDGSTFTTSDLTGQQGIQGIQGVAGANGTNGTNGLDGNGIASTVDNGDGTFTLTYDDGTTFTTSDLTGQQGIQGIQGVAGANGTNGTNGLDGNSIASTVDNGDGTFTLTYDDGTTFTTSDLTGPQGALGAQGPAGTNGISSTGVRIGFSSSSNWTCPIGITQITVELWGAGGGGGSVSGGAPGGNGGNGGYIKQIISVSPSTVYSVQIGGGGIGTTYFNSFTYQVGNGGNGGQSTFSLPGTVLLQADGGQGGIAGLMTGCSPNSWCAGTPSQSGAIINWPYPANIPSNPSAPYIPVGYVQNPPIRVAYGGQGGGYCTNGNQNSPCYSFVTCGGQVGEGGFCIISY